MGQTIYSEHLTNSLTTSLSTKLILALKDNFINQRR
uniref:Uncharacterized protein n=1 Tax=Nelumbo nucifera TaxID=4432 RepID=A0A822ZHL5_NELNU|nr:TPA_asm: hypothetical protein HUJ06_002240 [Nelumbo nucifera]